MAIVHNVVDHDASWWKWRMSHLQLRQADAYVTHTQDLAAGIREVVPEVPVAVYPHPVFAYPAARNALPKRAGLELLMFGLVRPYKGLDVLLEEMKTEGKEKRKELKMELDVVDAIGEAGLVTVPAKPTAAMLASGARAGDVSVECAWRIYHAMIKSND